MKNLLGVLLLFFGTNYSYAQNCVSGLGSAFPFNCYFDASTATSLHQFIQIAELAGSGCISGDFENILIKDVEITVNGTLFIESNAIFDNVIINMTEGSSIQIDAIPWIWGDLGMIPDFFNSNIVHNRVSFINGTRIQGCDKL